MTKFYVTIRNNEEGFYGAENHDNVDHEKTLAEYEKQITEAVRKVYGDAQITHEYGNYAGRSIIVESDENNEGEISDEISEIVSRVYNFGAFWIEK